MVAARRGGDVWREPAARVWVSRSTEGSLVATRSAPRGWVAVLGFDSP